ncbi:MAG: hypothetical protein IPP30_06000 [Flavobacterium sp.]|nr:hypothetical protein [Flavobacterium sp.]
MSRRLGWASNSIPERKRELLSNQICYISQFNECFVRGRCFGDEDIFGSNILFSDSMNKSVETFPTFSIKSSTFSETNHHEDIFLHDFSINEGE